MAIHFTKRQERNTQFHMFIVPHLFKKYTNSRIIHNDNSAAVKWFHNMTTKGLHYLQICENTVREEIASGFITVKKHSRNR